MTQDSNLEDFAAIPTTPVDEAQDVQPRRFTRFRLVVAIVAFCGVVCIAVGAIVFTHKSDQPDAKSIVNNIQQTPGLKVNIKALRSSMQVNGKSEVTVYIVPRAAQNASSALEFDAILTQEGDQVTEQYVLLDNRGYWSVSSGETLLRSGCLDASQIPPVQLVQTSLEKSRIVSDVVVDGSVVEMGCESGQLLKLSFAGETFVFCNSNTNQLSHARGNDLELSVEYLRDPTLVPDIVAPSDLNCPLVQTALPNLETAPTSSKNHLESIAGSAHLEASSCGCKGPKKPCLFVHGVGQKTSGPLTDTFADYWGSIDEHAPCCTTIKFAHMDTVSRGWDDASLQQEFCNLALQVATGNSGNTIGNLILTTHSMGNMFASAALVNNKCQFSSGVTWVSLAGPMQGSKSANLLVEKCKSGGWGDLAIKGILNLVGQCPAQPGYLSLLHQSTVDANRKNQFLAILSKRAQYVSKIVCGTSAVGLVTTDAALKIVGDLSKHDAANDGLVDINSCQAGYGTKGFGTTTSSANYQAALNHRDITFRNGDGWFGDDRKPIKWFECAL
ncbi:unnamed protein product [Aphanomyces euteiches]